MKRDDNGEFSLTEVLADDDIPKYAILSHRWGLSGDGVMFEGHSKGTGKEKNGYRKVQFCGEQSARASLQHFWIDTC